MLIKLSGPEQIFATTNQYGQSFEAQQMHISWSFIRNSNVRYIILIFLNICKIFWLSLNRIVESWMYFRKRRQWIQDTDEEKDEEDDEDDDKWL